MSTGPRPQAAFIPIDQSSAEQDASHAALFYLFQEVSKLGSPTRTGFLDSNSPFKWTNEASGPGGVFAGMEASDARLLQPCQHSLSCTSGEKEQRQGCEFTTGLGQHSECRSPWKVLSLINLQCERLMHRRHAEGAGQGSGSANVPKSHSVAKSLAAAAAADVQEHGCVAPVDDVRGVLKNRPQSSVEVCPKNCGVSVKAGACEREQEEGEAAEPSRCRHGEVGVKVRGQLVVDQECETKTFFSQQDVSSSCDMAEPQSFIPSSSQNIKLNLNSHEDNPVVLTLDCNANFVLTPEPPCELKPPSSPTVLPPPLLFNTSECQSFTEKDTEITEPKSECASTPIEEEPPVSAQPQSPYLLPVKQEPSVVQGVEVASSLTQEWKTKTPRKQSNPSRSVDIQDPDLQGVTFRMDTEMDDSREQCRLLITSKYRKEFCKSVRKPRMRTRMSQKSLKSSSSEDESDSAANVSKDKVCASCCTRKTPMWRDAEDGTPLCNACGIRYKKYRVRCVNCWHIPRKEGNSNSCCLKCGNFVKLTSVQRKHNP